MNISEGKNLENQPEQVLDDLEPAEDFVRPFFVYKELHHRRDLVKLHREEQRNRLRLRRSAFSKDPMDSDDTQKLHLRDSDLLKRIVRSLEENSFGERLKDDSSDSRLPENELYSRPMYTYKFKRRAIENSNEKNF